MGLARNFEAGLLCTHTCVQSVPHISPSLMHTMCRLSIPYLSSVDVVSSFTAFQGILVRCAYHFHHSSPV